MKHRVCIVGAGIGGQHMDGYAQLPDRWEMASVCDINLDRARPYAEKHGIGLTDDFAAVLADDSIDVVDIALPPHLHYQACIDGLRAGKSVICEKPLVVSLKEADEIAEVEAQSKGRLFPIFQYRYGVGAAQLHALIDAGLAGRCYTGSLETHWDRPASYYDIDWRGTWAGESGGAILGHAIHIHDLLTAFLGPIDRVFAEASTRVNEIEVEDCAALSIRMADGTPVTSSITLGCAENISRMRLMFEGFTVESDHAPYALAVAPWTFIARAPTTQAQIDAVLAEVGETVFDRYAGMFEAVADALEGKGGREVTLADGRASVEFVAACYHSARQGQAVTMPIGDDHPLYESWAP